MASRTNLFACKICGLEGMPEEMLRQHLRIAHIQGALQCPFCEISSKKLTVEEMNHHVNSAHLEYLTPEREYDGGFSEFEEDFSSIWQLEREAKAGLTNGLGESPTDDLNRITCNLQRKATCSDSMCSPMSTCTEISEITGHSSKSCQGDSSIASSSMSSPAASSSGAIQKRLKGSMSASANASPSRAGLTLDVRPCRFLAPSESLSSISELECPICQFKSSDPISLQNHVDRIHFNSPSVPQESKKKFSNGEDTLFTCPLCQHAFLAVLDLERHVNIDHGDILSPDDKKCGKKSNFNSNDDANGNLSCPVCNKYGFQNQNILANHVEEHFATPLETKPTPPLSKKRIHSFKFSTRTSSLSFPFASLSSSNSSSSSSVVSAANNDHLQSDYLFAQELARREQEKQKYEEQKEFDQLRAQFGMDNEGNYREQSLTNMQRAVYKGELSLVDYYERQVDLKESIESGVDEGHSVTKNIIPRLRVLCSSGVSQVYLCSTVDHHASSFGDKEWGCGYRNLQMILSSLQHHTSFADCLKSVLNGKTNLIPSIEKLQNLIEEAWSMGFDVQGRDQLGGRLKNTRKWIGASEIVAFLTSRRIRAELIDFHTPTGQEGTHPKLFQWVLNYFREHAAERKFTPPLYFQHQGHSRTIVGIEILSSGTDSIPRLLVFDPSHSRSLMSSLDCNSKTDNNTAVALKMLRKPVSMVKSKQYQIVAVTGVFESHKELSKHKVLHSKRIP